MFPKTAVILAGGLGSRVKKYLKNKPKPLLKVEKKFFLEILVGKLVKYNFNKILILVGYRGHEIAKLFHNKYFNFTKIECIKENKLLGTAGALYSLKKKIKSNFILVNGDTYFDIDYTKIKFKKKNPLIKIVLTKKLDNKNLKLNNISVKNNLIFIKQNSNFMNGGIYLIKKKFLRSIKNTKSSLETDFIPDLIKMKLVEGEYFKDFFYDIGTPKNFIRASSVFKSNLTKPAVFFDRDGVINHDKRGYTFKIKDFRLRKNVYKAINFLNKKGYHIFIITNQSGIAKGFYNINDFFKLHIFIKKKLIKNSCFINDVKFCPHHPKGKIKNFKKICECRKPKNLLFKQLLSSNFINLKKSFMIGDSFSDFLMAKKSNLYFEYSSKDIFNQIKNIIKNN